MGACQCLSLRRFCSRDHRPDLKRTPTEAKPITAAFPFCVKASDVAQLLGSHKYRLHVSLKSQDL